MSTGLATGTKLVVNGKGVELLHVILGVSSWLRDHYAYSTLMLLPLFSLASYWAFRRNHFNYLQHLILNAFIAGQRMVVFIVFLPITFYLKNLIQVGVIQDIETWIWVLMMTWTYVQFFNENKIIRSIVQTLKTYLYFAFLCIVLIVIVGIILAYCFV